MQELEKILEEIDQEKKNTALSIRHTTGYKAGQIRMAERIEEIIHKHMNDGWIPVSIRMPEKAGTYIINVLDGERDIVTFAKWQNRYKRFDMTGARAY